VSLQAVLFDAGNTLLFLDYLRMAQAVGAATGVALTAETLSRSAGTAAATLERGDVSDRQRASRYLEALFLLAGVPEAELGLVRDTLLALHRERHLWGALPPGTLAALDRLRAAGLRLGVVSNSDGRAEEGLAAAGILDRFEIVIDSQLVGVEKPDPRIFQAALARMSLAPPQALYVGDLYEVDVVGARRAGLDVILLDPLGLHRGRPVRTAANLTEVADLVLGPPAGSPALRAGPKPAGAPLTPDP
jgi:putative hydrolase of the HAD superfamily